MEGKLEILTTLVGSLPTPDWVHNAPNRPRAIADATAMIIHRQELAGIEVVVDGEVVRFDPSHPETNGMIEYFVLGMRGVYADATFAERQEYRKLPGMQFREKPPGVVRGPVEAGTLDLETASRLSKALARNRFKFALTGPHMLAKTLLDKHYGSTADLAMAIARVLAEQVRCIDADVVQLDEANLPGHPEEGEWAVGALNMVLDAVKSTAALHLCFGNYGGQRIQKGTWAPLVRFLNALHVDHLVLECARREDADVEGLKDIDPRIGLGVGVVDVKTTVIETPDQVANQIARIARLVGGIERIRYVHPDCGLWTLQPNVAYGKIGSLVKGRDLFLGRQ